MKTLQPDRITFRSFCLIIVCFAILPLCNGQSAGAKRSNVSHSDLPSNIRALIEKTLSKPYEDLNTDWFGTVQAEGVLLWADKGFPAAKDFVSGWLGYHIKNDSKMTDKENLDTYSGPKGRVIRIGPLPISVYAGTLGVAFPCYSLHKLTGDSDAKEVCVSVADVILHYSARDKFGYMAHDDNSYCKWCIPDVGYFSVRGLADASDLVDKTTGSVYMKDAVHQAKMSVMLFYDKDKKLTRTIYNLDQNQPGKTYWCRASGWMVYTLTALLRHLDKDSPDYKYFTSVYRDIADGLVKCQGPNGGLHVWVDDFSSPEEVTSTAMTAGCFSEAMDKGWLPPAYKDYVSKAWSFILSSVASDGTVKNAYTGWAIPAEARELVMDERELGFVPGMVMIAASQILK
jgi:hypothetical protein